MAWLTHDPNGTWAWAAKWAVVRPEAGPTCFRPSEADYAFDNSSGTMSVAEEDRRRYCHGDPELDDPRLPQAPGWPENLGGDLKQGMNRRWSEWLDRQWKVYKVEEDSRFGQWLAKEVNCRKNAESASIQKGLSKPFAPSIQVMCPEGDVSQWWRHNREP